MRYDPPRKRKKELDFVCLACGTSGKFYENVREGKFCSNKCQMDHKYATETTPKVLAGLADKRAVKGWLIKERGYRCEICSLSEWMGKPITLQIDHIDGDSDNNFPSNVRLLCPNCHSQTETFTGRNQKNSKRQLYQKRWREGHEPGGTAAGLHPATTAFDS